MTRKILLILIIVAVAAAAVYFWKFHRIQHIVHLQNPNILLITIDTIRPDHLSCYGGKNPTPNLDQLAQQGILFENAFSQVPLTFPSHTTILTGQFPTKHGIHNNGMEVFQKPEILISTQLKKRGYLTGAVVSSYVLDRKFGLNHGFDFYDDRMERQPGITSNFEVERPGNEVTTGGIQILERFHDHPWFLWLHYYDPHTPYAPPEPYSGYAGEVQFVDSQIGEILKWLKTNEKNQNLVVAVIGDHGESLGEHGEATHGFFTYNSTLKVPFLLSFPGAPNIKIQETSATVDLTPTLLALVGIKDPVNRDGINLLPLLDGEKRGRDIYFESKYAELLGWNGLQGLIRNDWKLISTTRSELYNWRSDPNEKQNQFSQQQSLSTKLKDELAKSYVETASATAKGPDAETLEKLKSLGYIGTTSVSKKERSADPKDKIEVWGKYEKLLELQQQGKKEDALKELKDLSDREPENNFFRITLATRYREAGSPNSAIDELQKAIKNDPTDAGAFQELALTYKEIRNYDEAVRAQQASLSLDPKRSDAYGLMGLLLVETGKFEEANRYFGEVLKRDPNNAVAWNNYGNSLREMNRLNEAENAYKEAIRLSPHYAFPLNGLATILVREKKTQDAIPYFQKALDLDPKFVEVYLNLGIAYHTLGETAKARTLYKTFLKISPDWMQQERANAQMLLNQLG
ncbi:MAG TPA: sulfatase-like hydrolase/transferase [Acidobacteriota bacterium]|nr:sulfatase-like hydrolase/transferase [Acidobacteriota bacterium]